MKRFTDEEYGKSSVHMDMQTELDMKYPNCNKRGVVIRNKCKKDMNPYLG